MSSDGLMFCSVIESDRLILIILPFAYHLLHHSISCCEHKKIQGLLLWMFIFCRFISLKTLKIKKVRFLKIHCIMFHQPYKVKAIICGYILSLFNLLLFFRVKSLYNDVCNGNSLKPDVRRQSQISSFRVIFMSKKWVGRSVGGKIFRDFW